MVKNVYICFNQLVNFYENTLPPLMLLNSSDRGVAGVFGPITKKYIYLIQWTVLFAILLLLYLFANVLFVSGVVGFFFPFGESFSVAQWNCACASMRLRETLTIFASQIRERCKNDDGKVKKSQRTCNDNADQARESGWYIKSNLTKKRERESERTSERVKADESGVNKKEELQSWLRN